MRLGVAACSAARIAVMSSPGSAGCRPRRAPAATWVAKKSQPQPFNVQSSPSGCRPAGRAGSGRVRGGTARSVRVPPRGRDDASGPARSGAGVSASNE